METGKRDIEQLWLRYVEELATPEELNELFASLGDIAQEAEHIALAQQAVMRAGSGLPADLQQEEAVWQQLLLQAGGLRESFSSAPSSPVRYMHFLHKWGWAAASLILAMAGIALYYTFSHAALSGARIVKTLSVPAPDIQPGYTRAVLTLSNGQQVTLDSTAAETIQDGGLAIENNNGQLIYKNGAITAMNTVATPKGGQYQVTLPDGTKVWLNASSSITFPTAFTGSRREVKIEGEIYFEVAKDELKPFLVDVDGKSLVEVLGTIFNINAYDDEGSIKTTLVQGSVKVVKGNRDAMLRPGQQAIVDLNTTAVATPSGRQHDPYPKTEDGIMIVSAVDLDQVLAWKNGIFNFNGADLQTVMRQLERWYNIKVQYRGAMPNLIFRGKMYRNVSLSDVLDMLKEMGVRFELEGDKLIVF
jgi:ferric-dicitrate binding protein FerR (iron transport regulator)